MVEEHHKNKNWLLIGIAVVAVIILAVVFIQKEEFVLSDDNFDLLSLSYHSYDKNSLNGICVSLYKPWEEDYTKYGFVITYNVKGVESTYLDEPLSCYIIIDRIKYYGKIQETGTQEIGSFHFCDNPYYKEGVGESCWYGRVHINKNTDVTLCCEGVCKTKNIPAYCK